METAKYESIEKDEKNYRLVCRQVVLCLTLMSFYFMVGLCMGTPTVAVPQLQQLANSTAAVSDEMASLITSIVPYSGVVWSLILTSTAHFYGRRISMMIVGVDTLAAFLIVYFSENILHIFISQLLQGMCNSAIVTVFLMITTEYSTPKYRGLFMSVNSATFYWGMWVANALGTFVHYKNIGIVGCACSMFNLIALYFIPESPYWLAFRGKYAQSAEAHRMLKGHSDETEKELEAMIKSQKAVKQCGVIRKSLIGYFDYYCKILTVPEIYKPIFLCLLVATVYNFVGKLVCAVYAVEIMKKITSTTAAAYGGVLILDGVTVVGTYVGSVLTKMFKRRTLLLSTSSICAVFLLLLALYLYLVKLSVVVENSYISFVLLSIYSLSASCGPMVVILAIYGELYPVSHRSFVMYIICFWVNVNFGTLLKLAPLIFSTFEMHGTFLFFGIGLTVGLILIYLYVPETKDKSLEEISKSFSSKKSKLTHEMQILEDGKSKIGNSAAQQLV